MKRCPLIILGILLLLLNACGEPAVAAAIPTNVPDPLHTAEAADIFAYLNMQIESKEISTKFEILEHIKGANYQVIAVSFIRDPNDGLLTFDIKTRCECAEDGPCCNSNKTLIATLMAMDDPNNGNPILKKVPPGVMKLEVETFDHKNPTDIIEIPWASMTTFLTSNNDPTSGLQLWAMITPMPRP